MTEMPAVWSQSAQRRVKSRATLTQRSSSIIRWDVHGSGSTKSGEWSLITPDSWRSSSPEGVVGNMRARVAE
jgi:hypothetical protein